MLQVDIDSGHVSTQLSHTVVVEQVIGMMREHLYEPLSLEDMADAACLSPYYFNRVFHSIVGIPPGEFLATLRLEAAKRLLLTTSLSVTDVCFEVGYVGLGSFTTRFTQLVGVPPRLLRHLAKNTTLSAPSMPDPSDARHITLPPLPPTNQQTRGAELATLKGRIHTTEAFHGLIFVGLFPKPIPQGRPVRCTLLTEPGPFQIDQIPDGRYFLMIAAMPVSSDPHIYLLPGAPLVAIHGPLLLTNVVAHEHVEIVLRPLRPTDPPIITALPFISTLQPV